MSRPIAFNHHFLMRKSRMRPFCTALLVAAAALPACSGKQAPEAPVATASLTFSKDRVPIGSAVTLTYKFDIAPGATLPSNDWVFVHMMDADGQMMWTDDHVPPTPTGQWKPGQTIQYQRTIFVPNYPYIGEASVRLGLYNRESGERLVLNNEETVRREYLVTRFRIAPQSENILVVYKDGWYAPEVDPNNPGRQWQWTQKTATVQFQNPKKDLTLYLEYAGRPDMFTPAQQVTLRIGDQPAAQFAMESKDPVLKTFPITAAQLGTAQLITLAFDLDRTFSPGVKDSRLLGFQVFHLYLEPKSPS